MTMLYQPPTFCSNMVLEHTLQSLWLTSFNRSIRTAYSTSFCVYFKFLNLHGVTFSCSATSDNRGLTFLFHCTLYSISPSASQHYQIMLVRYLFRFLHHVGWNLLTTKDITSLPRLSIILQAVKNPKFQQLVFGYQ